MDEADHPHTSSSADDGLPKGAVVKLVKEVTPDGMRCTPEAQALLRECLHEFLQMLAAEANEHSSREKKNTISEAHLLGALKSLGFERFTAACQSAGGTAQDHKALLRAEAKRKRKTQQSNLSPEELLKMQQELFAGARQKMEAERACD